MNNNNSNNSPNNTASKLPQQKIYNETSHAKKKFHPLVYLTLNSWPKETLRRQSVTNIETCRRKQAELTTCHLIPSVILGHFAGPARLFRMRGRVCLHVHFIIASGGSPTLIVFSFPSSSKGGLSFRQQTTRTSLWP